MVKPKIPGETKKQKFKRIASQRTRKVLDNVRVLEHCANRAVYEYDSNDIKEIFSAIEKAVKSAKSKFEKPVKADFTLK